MRTCLWCTELFDPGLDYNGRRHAPTRRYCRSDCTRRARNQRQREQRAHLRRWAGLIEMHALEAAGQLSLDPTPLPEVPELADGR